MRMKIIGEMMKKHLMKKVYPICPSDNVTSLLSGMARTGFYGCKLGELVDVWRRMLPDPECTTFFGLSGAMTPAGNRLDSCYFYYLF